MQFQISGVQSALTQEAQALLTETPPQTLQIFSQMAGELSAANQDLETEREQKEQSLKKLLVRMHDMIQVLAKENECLNVALEASERRQRDGFTLLEARLQEAESSAKAVQLASQAQEKQHQEQMQAVLKRLDAVSSQLTSRVEAVSAGLQSRVDTLQRQFAQHTHSYMDCSWNGVRSKCATSGPVY